MPEAGPKPKFQVVEKYNLHYITNAGDELVFGLDIPTGVILDVMTAGDTQQEQFAAMLAAMGDEATLKKWRSLGFISEGSVIMTRYFDEFEKLTGATPGKSESSSDL